jgi:hypothetical protein
MMFACESIRGVSRIFLAAGFISMALSAGCDSVVGDGDDDAGVDNPDSVGEIIDWYGSYIDSCYQSGTLLELIEPGDTRFEFNFDDELARLEALWRDESTVGIDDEQAALCLDALRPYADSCDPIADTVSDTCDSVFIGKVENGDECEDSVQCASKNCQTDDDGCGLCEPFLELGDACLDEEEGSLGDCDESNGEYCDFGTEKCESYRLENEVCVVDDVEYQCDYPASCDEDSGECQGPAENGENCDDRFCAPGLESDYDDDTDRCTCIVPPGPKSQGDACAVGQVDDCDIEATALACVDLDDDGSWACESITAEAEGDACDSDLSGASDQVLTKFCLHGYTTHYCAISDGEDTGLCTKRAAAGESCIDGEQYVPCVWPEATCSEDGLDFSCQANATLGESCSDAECAWPLDCDEESSEPVCIDRDAPAICE